jgi:hypothetical protein
VVLQIAISDGCSLLILSPRVKDPLYSSSPVLFGLLDELYFTRHKVENLSHQLHPLVELVRGLFINRPARFAPIFRPQPRFSARARKRALVALNALWSVVGITLVAKRRA